MNVQNLGSKLTESLAKAYCEHMAAAGTLSEGFKRNVKLSSQAMKFKEALGDNFQRAFLTGNFKEDLTTSYGTSGGAWVTALSEDVIFKAAEASKEILEAVVIFDDKLDSIGAGAYQIPLMHPVVATVEGPKSGANTSWTSATWDENRNRNDAGMTITPVTIQPEKLYVLTNITWEFTKFVRPSILKWVVTNMEIAATRQLSVRALAAMVDGTNALSNVEIDDNDDIYDSIIDAEAKIASARDGTIPLGFEATHLFLTPLATARLKKSVSYKAQIQVNIVNDKGTINKPVERISTMKLVQTPFLPSSVIGVACDGRFSLAMAKWSDTEAFDVSLPGHPWDKQIAIISMIGFKTLFDKASCTITEKSS